MREANDFTTSLWSGDLRPFFILAADFPLNFKALPYSIAEAENYNFETK